MKMNNVIFIMGVSGCGKTTIGKLLSEELSLPFFDADDFHSVANIKKMSEGKPLNDTDREGWLKIINKLAIDQSLKKGCVIACSALKEHYRFILSTKLETNAKWVYLSGSFEDVYNQISERKNHFMPSELLQSQFEILEVPANAIEVSITNSPLEIIKIIKKQYMKSEFGLFGLGVMGKSLTRNLANNGFKISMFNRHVAGVSENVAVNFKNEHDELSNTLAFDNIEAFVNSLQTPRKIMLMVNAGKVTDYVIEDLLPYLSEGDTLIDGGNSNYKKTKERSAYLKSKNIYFIGTGVSGGEEGALKGPSIMPGGSKETYESIAPFLNAIAAKDKNNLPCCTYIGPDGSGHFVKMVHNGIEYAEMQLLAEVYVILKELGNIPDEIADILESWKASASSYLLEITIDILRKKEGDDWLVNKIMDKAGNKGTGNWTTIATAELGVSSSLIASALFARYTSFYKEERVQLNKLYDKQTQTPKITVAEVFETYQFARIVNHYQGIKLIAEASKAFEWHINLSEMARIWTNGCIIRSTFMEELVEILKETDNILTNSVIVDQTKSLKPSANKVIAQCALAELPIVCMSESVNFFNGLTTADSSANIIQAQRDYFGSHTYQRLDDESGAFYHTEWINE
ncbi:NADP-dependent phosphogluconate dehydrogenase [Winogradskyella vidalii]|uniref:NADP-dependent phosphogluconate dehydrogenase n=1 Tax=Winogradskyella vidalii TaxID=2615024 RepID=UPI001FE3203E|nr:NADP-dependent phosphogluconate dehydrogenase [Winogradskyella vidalii]